MTEAVTTNRLVEMKGIHKSFGTVQALRGVDFHVDRQEIVGLLGDNGAGKSTLIKILTGVHTPTKGEIYFEGRHVEINSPNDARALGIETVYQDLALVPLISIARNFWLGQEPTKRFGPIKVLDKKKMSELAREALLEIGIKIRNPDEPVAMMSGGERQSIAIGR
ncbi:MAG: ATP-binding cassette domain-containing protein, partial [Anaerolinea sp.]|nr:ATP-binding cassette domain-containing protein [Anaerolinea sp.]